MVYPKGRAGYTVLSQGDIGFMMAAPRMEFHPPMQLLVGNLSSVGLRG